MDVCDIPEGLKAELYSSYLLIYICLVIVYLNLYFRAMPHFIDFQCKYITMTGMNFLNQKHAA